MTKKELLKKYLIINHDKKNLTTLLNNIYIEINIDNYCEMLLKDKSVINFKVEEKDPFNINYIENAIGFRFYDISDIIIGNEKFIGNKKNYSSFFYYGKKYNKDELNETLLTNPSKEILEAINILESKELNYAIICDCGKIITNPFGNSVTMEELNDKLENNNNFHNYKRKTKN